MREVRIVITCDWCGREMPEDAVRTIKIAFGSTEFEGEACAECCDPMRQKMRPVKKRRTRRKTA